MLPIPPCNSIFANTSKNVLTRYFPVYPIWFLCFIIKSKLRRADEAEAVVVVPVVGVVVVPVRDGTV